MDPLPYLTASLPGVGGELRSTPEDFRVDELPAYLPSGEGEHLYVRFEKRGLATPAAVQAIAKALGADPREAGWAGLKDRHAVTTQWASFARADADRARELQLDGITVLEVARHRNKLRTGHLHGNRFTLRLRGIAEVPEAVGRCTAIAAVLTARGVPNYFGDQRFGRDGDNAARGIAWLRGESPPPRDPFLRKLFVSAVQSELFNRYLCARVLNGEMDRFVDGDLAMRHPAGRPWVVEASEAQSLYDSHLVSATGPVFGTRMSWPDGDARAREEAVFATATVTMDHFARARDLGDGTRRAVRMFPGALTITEEQAAVRLEFDLPAGGYATVVMREFQKREDDGLKPSASDGIPLPALSSIDD